MKEDKITDAIAPIAVAIFAPMAFVALGFVMAIVFLAWPIVDWIRKDLAK